MRILFFLTVLLCFMQTAVAGRIKSDSFERGVPKHWKLLGTGRLSVSPWHYKDGKKSLKWDFRAGDSIRINNTLGKLSGRGGCHNVGFPAFGAWIYVEKAMPKKFLRLDFRTGNKSNAHVNIPLNFTGWQGVFLQYRKGWINKHFLQGKVQESTDNILIKAPRDCDGTVFFDLIVYKGYLIGRVDRIPRQFPYKTDIKNAKFSVPKKVSKKDIEAIKKLKLLVFPKEKTTVSDEQTTRFNLLMKRLKAFNIIEDEKGIRGLPLKIPTSGDDQLVNMNFYSENGIKNITSFRLTARHDMLLLHYHLNKYGISKKQKKVLAPYMLALFKHLMDQGYNTSSLRSLGTYFTKTLFDSVYYLRNDLAKDKVFYKKMMDYLRFNGLDPYLPSMVDSYTDSKIPTSNAGLNASPISAIHMDAFQTLKAKYAFAILANQSLKEQIRALQYLSYKLSKEILTGNMPNGFKADGSGYHHRMNYFSYMQGALTKIAPIVYACKGSDFAISKKAYERLKKAVLNASFYSNGGFIPLAMQGRCPYALFYNYYYCKNTRMPKVIKLLALASPDKDIDRELAQAYINMNPSDKKFAEKYKLQEKICEGNLALPYAGIVTQRRKGWSATAAGYGKYFKGVEIYADSNRFGRYLNNGSLDILGKDGLWKSGNSRNGWDWNRINGATVIYYPIDKLRTKTLEPRIFTRYGFFGGISWRNKNGCFAMQLDSRCGTLLRGKKSYFMIGERIYALGSNIKGYDRLHPVQTNLYQKFLDSKDKPTYVDGEKITAFSVNDKALDSNKAHYLLDTVGNGYYLAKGQKVFYARKTQKSRDASDGVLKAKYGVDLRKIADTKGDFATAWIDHGTRPKGAGYEYVVLPYCEEKALAEFARKAEAREIYKILRKDAKAHIIHDKIDGFYAAVFFKGGAVTDLPHVVNVQRNCMIIYKETDGQLELAIGNPDVNRRYQAPFYYESVLKPLTVTFAGKWKLVKPKDGIKIIDSQKDKTTIEFACIHGKTFNFSLKN